MVIHTSHYDIHIGEERRSLLPLLQSMQRGKWVVLVDGNTEVHCLPILWDMLGMECPIIRVTAGEIHKNMASCRHIWGELMQMKVGRDGLLLNLGGGVIGDMGGFCAATFKRGIGFVQIPSTLLSQVDASVGGKLGVDFLGVKNGIGLFGQPEMVWIDPVFLATLPPRELRSGYAEVLKHALIQDAERWRRLSSLNWDSIRDWASIIEEAIITKRDIVELDPYEKGIRKALNFGHTIGHAVEGVSLQKKVPLLHGEAVALGIVCEAYLSYHKTGLPKEELDEIRQTVLRQYGRVEIAKTDLPAILALMQNDKKNRDGELNCTLLERVGSAVVDQVVTEAEVLDCLDWYVKDQK